MQGRSRFLFMKITPSCNFKFSSLLLALASAGCFGVASAAMLGEIQVRSALGERFSASITVAAAEDEDLSASCFRLVSPQDENANGVLRRARLTYQYEVGGGRLLVKGDEAANEPVVTLGVRVKCPSEEERVFQRDYRILLDPPEYRPNIVLPSTNGSIASKGGTTRRKLPALGSVWLSEEGDSVARIAASYYPGDKVRQQAMVEAIYDINPDLPQNTNAKLGGDWRILLPAPIGKTDKAVPAPIARADRLPAAAKNLEALPRLTLGTDLADLPAKPEPAPIEPESSGPSEFRLRLSDTTLDTTKNNTLTPDQALQLRERLLSLESDDQAAQMLQLKYQINELEKKLARTQSGPAAANEDGSPRLESQRSWLDFWPLLGFLLVPIGFVAWRRWQGESTQDELYTVISPSTAYLSAGTRSGGESHLRGQGVTLGGLDSHEIATPIHREHSHEDWNNSDMDVVSPGNVTEEAQLLLDHGLVPQAINLLNHEIAQMPAALALWMKLFEIFQRNNMPEAFQEKAVAFRLQFASDGLWQNVQELGRSIDPANPLYQSIESQAESASELDVGFSNNQDDLAFASALHAGAGLDMPGQMLGSEDELLADELAGKPDIELEPVEPEPELIYYSQSDVVLPQEQEQEAEQAIELHSLNAEHEIQIDAVLSVDGLENKTSPNLLMGLQRDAKLSFKSDDPALQEVAQLIDAGQRKEAFKLLEEMLYKGTMSQRLTASKWLDKMLGTFGHN